MEKEKRTVMETMKQGIIGKTAITIAQKEIPHVNRENMWVFSLFCYEYGIPVYQIKAYGDLTCYDIIIDALTGTVLKITESCP